MWRRAYLLLALVRLYFALSPSYIHPDEAFQGPEIIAGQIYGYPVKKTWEFTSDNPIRSVFPLWPVYGLPMLLLKWLWLGHDGEVTPKIVFYTLRILMFFVSFVLEDWAIHELVPNKRQQRQAIMLVASSYVTWTYQTHTFSNSIETIVLAWSLVLINRIVGDKARSPGRINYWPIANFLQRRTSPFASAILAMLAVFGTFNRITFPAFLIIPVLQLIPHFAKKPISFLIMVASGLFTLFIAITLDTEFYTEGRVTWATLFSNPIITPLNNLKYNLQSSNLALHGTHPRYQHALANLPMLIGPVFALLFWRPQWTLRIYSAISGLAVLSIFQHQEARFLMPLVPLLLSSARLPENPRVRKIWMSVWIGFNVIFGLLMGKYHQGGVVPTQFHISGIEDATHALWWKTYSPPIWLLNGKNEILTTHDLMGMKGDLMIRELQKLATCSDGPESENTKGTYLVAPLSATFLDTYTSQEGKNEAGLELRKVWQYRTHLNLDDLDFGDDGIWPTLSRVIGRRGLGVWRVTKSCSPRVELEHEPGK